MKLADVSDDELMSRLNGLLGSEHRLLARLIVHLIEVEERRLDKRSAHSSMIDFCIRRLGLSESEAYRRITAARLVRRFPQILEKLERRQIHLSAIVMLRDHLTDANHEELVAMACGRRKRELQELLAGRFPRPDVPARIRKLPTRQAEDVTGSTRALAGEASATTAGVAHPAEPGSGAAASAEPNTIAGSASGAPSATGLPKRQVLEPLSETRYKLQLTIGVEMREKLDRARRLMSHSNPTGELAAVLERALDLLLADLEKSKLGKSTRPRRPPETKTKTKTKTGYVTRAVRRTCSRAMANNAHSSTSTGIVARHALSWSSITSSHERSAARTTPQTFVFDVELTTTCTPNRFSDARTWSGR